MSKRLELVSGPKGESPKARLSDEPRPAGHEDGRSGKDDEKLLELVVARSNVRAALKRVRSNKGSPGIDGMTVEELPAYLNQHWSRICEEILAGRYRPMAVRQVEIPKKDGGVRKLGIPTVLDRLIQQCILHVLQPRFDPTFSQHSHGFRPGRSAHDAIRAAQRFIQEGRNWVVDVDLEAFFDRVNHDVLMSRLAKRIADRRLLRLVRHYLDAGIMVRGVERARHEGTPQGGPLSPLLANVLLDEVDKELEKRGHAFARYADDCNVYVRSKRAGDRVMSTLRRLFAGLHLRINEAKSAVGYPSRRKFLGFSFWKARGGIVKIRVADLAKKEMKDRVRVITKRTCGRSIPSVIDELRGYLIGWKNYFQLAQTPRIFVELDQWIRHRLRSLQLRQWKKASKVQRELVQRGISLPEARKIAVNHRSCWRTARQKAMNFALPPKYYDGLKLPRLAATSTR